MTSHLPTSFRQHLAALRVLLVLTVILGIGYPLAITAVAQVVPGRADGQLIHRGGTVVGARNLGQSFTDADGTAIPKYFQSRPSSAGDGYDPTASSASNLGPESPDLISAIKDRRAAAAESDGVHPSQVPPDAVTGSGSGLDPDISPEYAMIQVQRVARARGVTDAVVTKIVQEHTDGRDAGFIGAPHVNVLELNLALDRLPDNG